MALCAYQDLLQIDKDYKKINSILQLHIAHAVKCIKQLYGVVSILTHQLIISRVFNLFIGVDYSCFIAQKSILLIRPLGIENSIEIARISKKT